MFLLSQSIWWPWGHHWAQHVQKTTDDGVLLLSLERKMRWQKCETLSWLSSRSNLASFAVFYNDFGTFCRNWESFRREGTAHRQNLYTQTPDSPHSCGRLVHYAICKKLLCTGTSPDLPTSLESNSENNGFRETILNNWQIVIFFGLNSYVFLIW